MTTWVHRAGNFSETCAVLASIRPIPSAGRSRSRHPIGLCRVRRVGRLGKRLLVPERVARHWRPGGFRPQKHLIDRARSDRLSPMPNSPTILVLDSGLGGLTVLREIVRLRPDAHYVYVADDAFFPYGHHGEDQIIARVVPMIGELIAAHAPDLIVIACNTISTLVMSHLRDAYKVPFVGTVPAIKPACASAI